MTSLIVPFPLERAAAPLRTGEEKDKTLEELLKLFLANRVRASEKAMREAGLKITECSEQIRSLHKLISVINKESENGKLEIGTSSALPALFEKARELGLEISDKTSWSKEDRDNLIGDIRFTADDLANKNEMNRQDLQLYNNQFYEAYEMAKNNFKTLHETILRLARGGK